jgi:hypothetical protein
VDRLRDAPLIYRIGNGLMGRNTEHRSANPVESMMELEHREGQELLVPPPQVDAELSRAGPSVSSSACGNGHHSHNDACDAEHVSSGE